MTTVDRLELLKALADPTRDAILTVLREDGGTMSTNEIATALDLHPNSIRPHLERLRDVGLLGARASSTGRVGRPTNRYWLADDPLAAVTSDHPLMSASTEVLVDVCLAHDAGIEAIEAAGHTWGGRYARSASSSSAGVAVAEHVMIDFGFAPVRSSTPNTSVALRFLRCPFAELSHERLPLICALHRGILSGIAEECGDVSLCFFEVEPARNGVPNGCEARFISDTIESVP